MLGTKEVRERIEVYLEKLENFTTTDLKRLLKDDGYIYNVDYDVYAFSNAVAYLKRNSYIEPTGGKGSYRVIKKKSKSVEE